MFESMSFLNSFVGMESKEIIANIKKDHRAGYFLGNILHKEWLLRQYVNRVLQYNELPEWQLFVQISALYYEKRIIHTKLYFADRTWHINKNTGIIFYEEKEKKIYQLADTNLRTIRKLMELSGERHGLLVKKPDYCIEGVIRSSKRTPALSIEFLDHLVWQFQKDKSIMFKYKKGGFILPVLEDEENIGSQISKLERFSLDHERMEKIKDIIISIKNNASHGSSIVFMDSEKLEAEVERLVSHNRVYRVRFHLQDHKEELKGITAIDGAIMADMDCECLGVGAILDGKSLIPGDAGRGARYNSVANYVNVIDKEARNSCFAVVISEDGMINIVVSDGSQHIQNRNINRDEKL